MSNGETDTAIRSTPRYSVLDLIAWVVYGALLISSIILWASLPSQAGSFMAYVARQDFISLYVGSNLFVTG